MMLEWDKTKQQSKIILDNNFGITDWDTLEVMERFVSSTRIFELSKNEKVDDIIFNKEYFLSIHKYLFQDIYPWAGTIREVNLNKGTSIFELVMYVNSSLDYIFESLEKDNYLKGFSLAETAELASHYLLSFNYVHPFREGNGRTKRHFMQQLLKSAGYDLGLNKIPADQLVEADIRAFDNEETGIKGNQSYFKSLIKSSLKPLSENTKNYEPTSKLEELNRFLWVYDRYEEVGWFTDEPSLESAENKLKEYFEKGVEGKIKNILSLIILREQVTLDGTAEYRKDIIEKARTYQKEIDAGLIIKKENAGISKKADSQKSNKNILNTEEKKFNIEEFDPKNNSDNINNYLKKKTQAFVAGKEKKINNKKQIEK